MPRGNTPEARRLRNAQGDAWNKEHTRRVAMRLNLNTDADILAHLDQKQNVQGYLKQLIRDDIARNQNQ